MQNEVEHLITAYEALLMIKTHSTFRVKNQHVYASIRDAIAETLSCYPDTIHDRFEGAAMIKRNLG